MIDRLSDHNHDHDHTGAHCVVCSGEMDGRSMETWEAKCLRESGFYIHYVAPIPDSQFVNFHTHGFTKSWGHTDLQIVFPIPARVAHSIFWEVADRVKAGERFVAGEYDRVIKNFPVRMVDAHEMGRRVLRIVLPDKHGRFPGDADVAPVFGDQIEADVNVED